MANTKSEQQWLSICISLGCQEPIMDWGGHGALSLPDELLILEEGQLLESIRLQYSSKPMATHSPG